jgi:hypothetical protein
MVYSRKNRKSSRKDSRKNRKSSRKDSRKNRKDSRKNRKSSRKSNMRRSNYFGGYNPMELSLAQGRQYQELHQGQHGGSSMQMAHGAPVGYSGMLPDDLRASARVEPTFASFQQIQGMSDMPQAPQQTGGRRRKASKKSKKSRKASKKSKKSRKASKKSRKASKKSKKSSKSSRKMRGGMAEISSPTMLLSPAMAAKAGTADFSNPLLLK